MSTLLATAEPESVVNANTSTPPLRECVQSAVEKYFAHLDGQATSDLYNMVLSEIEEPLLQTVLAFTNGNQSKAAIILGLSRGTLRKKLELYGLL